MQSPLSQAQLFIKTAQTSVLSSGELGLGKQVMLWGPCGTDCNVSNQQRSVHLLRNVSRDGCRGCAPVQFYYLALFLEPGKTRMVLLINSFTRALACSWLLHFSSLAEKFSFRWAMLYLP